MNDPGPALPRLLPDRDPKLSLPGGPDSLKLTDGAQHPTHYFVNVL
jgi:hypothetical protein